MTTLHLEVTITDLAGFKKSFGGYTEMRTKLGVRAESVRQPIDDDSLVLIDLDFDSPAEAESYVEFLKDKIWKDNPVMTGTPDYRILEPLTYG